MRVVSSSPKLQFSDCLMNLLWKLAADRFAFLLVGKGKYKSIAGGICVSKKNSDLLSRSFSWILFGTGWMGV